MGLVIILEGIVCSGKTSLWNDLKKEYPKFVYFEEAAKLLSEQGHQLGNKTNTRTEDVLLDVYIRDFLEARERSDEGNICILDRSYLSKLTYDFVRMFQTDFDDWTLVDTMNNIREFVKPEKPTAYIYLDLDIKEAMRRSQKKRYELQTTLDEFWFLQLKNVYELLFRSLEKDVRIERIDANNSYDIVKEKVFVFIEQLLCEYSLYKNYDIRTVSV